MHLGHSADELLFVNKIISILGLGSTCRLHTCSQETPVSNMIHINHCISSLSVTLSTCEPPANASLLSNRLLLHLGHTTYHTSMCQQDTVANGQFEADDSTGQDSQHIQMIRVIMLVAGEIWQQFAGFRFLIFLHNTKYFGW